MFFFLKFIYFQLQFFKRGDIRIFAYRISQFSSKKNDSKSLPYTSDKRSCPSLNGGSLKITTTVPLRYPFRIFLQDFPLRYPFRIFLQDIPLGYPFRISLQDIPLGYPFKISFQDIPLRYPFRISLQDISCGYPSGYPFRISL